MQCKIQSPLCGQAVFPIKWFPIPILISYELFPRFLLQNDPSGGAVPCKGRQSSFLNTLGKTVPHPQLCLQTTAVFTFVKGGREECLQASVLAHFPSLLLGGADFVLTVGWATECWFEECLSSWPNPLFGSCCCCSCNCWVHCCPKQMSE